MTLRRTLLAACTLAALASCAKLETKTIGLGGQCSANADCAEPYVCVNAVCSFPAYKSCTPDVKSCVGDAVAQCKPDGSGYIWLDAAGAEAAAPVSCAAGCFLGACNAPTCTANTEKKCVGNVIQQCNAAGSGFVTFQVCPAGCETTAGGIECKAPVCNPFETRCKPGDSTGSKLETCNSSGSAWNESTCPSNPDSVCFSDAAGSGRCVAKTCSVQRDGTGAITSRQERCNGIVREACSDDGSRYNPIEVCSTVCNENAVARTTTCAARNCITSTGQVADAFQTECSSTDADFLKRCDARGLEWINVDCTTEMGTEATCVRGRCLPKVCSNASPTNREQRCSGNIREQCNDSETAFEPIVGDGSNPNPCPFGCLENAGSATCRAAECTVGQEKCDGDSIFRCNSEGTFTFVQLCASGCSVSGSGATADASCRNAVCNPLTRRCGSFNGSPSVEQCRADGTGYDQIEVCSSACASGVCTITPSTCVPGNLRCRGRETEVCVRLPNQDTEWRFTGYCLGNCIDGTCDDDGACACSGSSEPPAAACGSATRQPIVLKVMLPPDEPAATIPCDGGRSSVLVYSEPIADSNGRPVPDGTLITFSVQTQSPTDTASLPAFISADADANMPGLQRPTLHGRARVVISTPEQLDCPVQQGLTPPAPRPLTVKAVLGDRCAGTATVPYKNRASGEPRFTYIAEDFSTTRRLSRRETTSMWDVASGRAAAYASFDLGTGADGDVTVAPGAAATDLNANYGLMFNVTAIQAQSITIDRFPTGLDAGTEVLVVTQNSPSNTYNGVFEFRRVVATGGNTVVFDRPFTRQFVSNPSDLSGVRVIAQKVPNFNNLTIDATGSALADLRATSPSPTTSGIVAFRATGKVSVKGRIVANGYVNTSGYTASVAAYVDRLAVGASGTGSPGGGVVYITAAELAFETGGPAAPFISSAQVADSAGVMYIGTGIYRAIPSAASLLRVGNGGVVRLDYSTAPDTVDAADLSNDIDPAQTPFHGQAGPYTVTSGIVLDVATQSSVIGSVRLVGGIFTRGLDTVVGPATSIPGFGATGLLSRQESASDTPVSLSDGNRVSGLANTPTRFRWQASIAPLTDDLYGISGIAFRACDLECN